MVANGYFMYVIECVDGSLYTGYTTDVIRRYQQHVSGKGAKYTRSHHPKKLLYYEQFEDQHAALHAEHEFKQKKRDAKFAYIRDHGSDLPPLTD